MASTFLLPIEPIASLDAYLASDVGGLGLDAAQRIGPQATIALVTESGLRGRGGGGFPTGRKWAGIAGQTTAVATWSATRPRASPARSRTGR
jgi:NADH-quinone oxidoreductase subunit F